MAQRALSPNFRYRWYNWWPLMIGDGEDLNVADYGKQKTPVLYFILDGLPISDLQISEVDVDLQIVAVRNSQGWPLVTSESMVRSSATGLRPDPPARLLTPEDMESHQRFGITDRTIMAQWPNLSFRSSAEWQELVLADDTSCNIEFHPTEYELKFVISFGPNSPESQYVKHQVMPVIY